MDLVKKVKGMKRLRLEKLSKNLELLEREDTKQISSERTDYDIRAVAIGSSTGGPAALKIVLTRLPSDFPAGVVVSQHMPKGFTASFAERLNGISKVLIKEAKEGDEVEKGKVPHMSRRLPYAFKEKGTQGSCDDKRTEGYG